MVKYLIIHPEVDEKASLLTYIKSGVKIMTPDISAYGTFTYTDLSAVDISNQNITHIGVVFEPNVIQDYTVALGYNFTSYTYYTDELIELFEILNNFPDYVYFDIIASNMNASAFIAETNYLATLYPNVIVRYSTDGTGNIVGNWIQESVNTNIRTTYFNDTVINWRGDLGVERVKFRVAEPSPDGGTYTNYKIYFGPNFSLTGDASNNKTVFEAVADMSSVLTNNQLYKYQIAPASYSGYSINLNEDASFNRNVHFVDFNSVTRPYFDSANNNITYPYSDTLHIGVVDSDKYKMGNFYFNPNNKIAERTTPQSFSYGQVIADISCVNGGDIYDVSDNLYFKVTIQTIGGFIGQNEDGVKLIMSNGEAATLVPRTNDYTTYTNQMTFSNGVYAYNSPLFFKYTIGANDASTNKLSVSHIDATNSIISRTTPVVCSSRIGVNIRDIQVKCPIAVVTNIATSNTHGVTYYEGDVISISVTFDANVNNVSTPRLYLSNGCYANYYSGTGTPTLVFRYVIGANDTRTTNLQVNSINTASGSIQDTQWLNTVNYSITGYNLGTGDIIVASRGTSPTYASVVGKSYGSTITIGETVYIDVTFNRNLTLSDVSYNNTKLYLNTNDYANYYSAPASNQMRFVYTIGEDSDIGDWKVLSFDYSSCTVTDSNGYKVYTGTIRPGSTMGNYFYNIQGIAIDANVGVVEVITSDYTRTDFNSYVLSFDSLAANSSANNYNPSTGTFQLTFVDTNSEYAGTSVPYKNYVSMDICSNAVPSGTKMDVAIYTMNFLAARNFNFDMTVYEGFHHYSGIFDIAPYDVSINGYVTMSFGTTISMNGVDEPLLYKLNLDENKWYLSNADNYSYNYSSNVVTARIYSFGMYALGIIGNRLELIGDPYILNLRGVSSKLPNKAAVYRLFEYGDFFVNGSVRWFTDAEKTAIRQYYCEKNQTDDVSIADVERDYKLITDGVIYDKLAIYYGDQSCEVSMTDLKLKRTEGIYTGQSYKSYGIIDGIEEACVVYPIIVPHKELGVVRIGVEIYENPQIMYGVRLFVANKVKKMQGVSGLFADNYRHKCMEIKRISERRSHKLERTMREAKKRGTLYVQNTASIIKPREKWRATPY